MENYELVLNLLIWGNVISFVFASYRRWGESSIRGDDLWGDEDALTAFANDIFKYAFIAPYFALKFLWCDFALWVVEDKNGGVNRGD